jgi:hypothetical protein
VRRRERIEEREKQVCERRIEKKKEEDEASICHDSTNSIFLQ